MKRLIFVFLFFSVAIAQKEIDIDFCNVVDTMKADLFGGIKGPSFASEYLHAVGIKYIRTHDYHGPADYCFYSDFWNRDSAGNFTTINEGFNPDDPGDYYWASTDFKMRLIVENDFEIYFRLGVSFPNPAFEPQIYEPPIDSYDDTLSFGRFASLCKHTAMHYNDGWADGTYYGIRYFELWCEPGGVFWDGSPVQFYYMFKFVSDTMKSYDPDIKIGGPGLVAGGVLGANRNYREKFLEFMDSTDTQLDFYSWHLTGIKNPYSIVAYADTFRQMIDYYGYNNAESHFVFITSEDSDRVAYSAKGAAHYAACAMALQHSSIDKIFWYPYNFMIVTPSSDTAFTQTANVLKAFHLLQEETPLILSSTGDEVVFHPFDSDTTTFMTLAAKSSDGTKLYILIANSKSLNENYAIHINNLHWSEGDTVRLTRNVVIDTLNFIEDESMLSGGDSLILMFDSLAAPSVLFLRLENLSISGIVSSHNESAGNIIRVFQNPFRAVCEIDVPVGANVEICDVAGKVVFISQSGTQAEFGNDEFRRVLWRPDDKVTAGVYFIRAMWKGAQKTEKVLYLK